jgi:hypothetical protein
LELCSCLHAYGRWLKRQNKKDDAAEMMQRAWRICEEFPGYLEEGELAAELAQLG